MDYTLFRGHEMLGRIRLRLSADDPALVHGMLEIASSTATVDSVQQIRFQHGEHVRVFEQALPELTAIPRTSRRQASAVARDGPRRLSPEDAMGVPVDRVLTLRDTSGEIVATDRIMLSRLPESFVRSTYWLARCADAGVAISTWSVHAYRQSRPER